ncbi:3'(2'),5'-bisphosphate nucleotidase CysQ [Myxacorys almedinensis A]|uniref:inositol-phosphate phosphatase n=1 Tax=Myxacorys almedinensis A TaxID=2690445 RepID=A0A8J7Z288_9CYAN|nr:3'(2'),5'-bisphosphate nucleotidase CysQ [Myxacorys almedinensis]NDJ16846.1 3'(2'),5'-bisphosphate nucleotidase CysQ [Myxacorys almedinensis A]
MDEILAIACAIGWGTADILLNAQRSSFAIETSGDSPVTSADLAANHYILNNLQATFGLQEFAYLSEETFAAQPASDRLGKPWVWIIDPLDGTKDFINRTGEYAVHIALTHQGRPVLAIVACPELDKLYYATRNGGAFVETRHQSPKPLHVSTQSQPETLTLVASRSHRDQRFAKLLERFPCKGQKQMGSVGCKIAAIAEQSADLYLSLSGNSAPKDWDFAAPELILTEAGGKFTHFDGSPLQYNREEVSQWGGILASNGKCHEELCAIAENLLKAIHV